MEEEKEMMVDMEVLTTSFTPGEDGEVPLEPYIRGYVEINEFFRIMGPLFQIIAYDVENKVTALKRLQKSKNGEHYVSVRSMVEFEVSEGLTLPDRHAHLSGVKKLSRLHRALEFVKQFIEELMKSDDEEESLAMRTREIYRSTCGRFHPKVVVKTLCGLFFLVPDRSDIREKLTKNNPEVEEKLIQQMPGLAEAVKKTYDATQVIYAAHKILDID